VSCVSVIVPVGFDGSQLAAVHRETAERIAKLAPEWEFLYLVSTPPHGPLDAALALHDADPTHVRVLRFSHAAGEGAALATAFERARGDLIYIVPPERKADPTAIDQLYQAIAAGADFAIGSRAAWRDGGGRALSRLFNRLVSRAAGIRVEDIASPLKALRRELLDEIPVYGDFHRYLPILADRAGFSVREVAVRPHAEPSPPIVHRPETYLWRALDLLSIFFLTRFTRRPLRLFGGLGALFGASGAAILLVVGLQRLLGTPLADRPIFVLGTLLAGLGVQSFAIGLLGELILYFQARSIRDYRVAAVYESDPAPLPREDPDRVDP
jgi:glycosyltransferase involved in cell wall biosynthesis